MASVNLDYELSHCKTRLYDDVIGWMHTGSPPYFVAVPGFNLSDYHSSVPTCQIKIQSLNLICFQPSPYITGTVSTGSASESIGKSCQCVASKVQGK